MPVAPSRRFQVDGEQWSLSRVPAGWGGAVAEDELPPLVSNGGLRFESETGEVRFLRLSHTDLPTVEEVLEMTNEQLVDLLARAV